MAVQNNRNRLSLPFTPNGQVTFNLSLGGKITHGWVKVWGTLITSAVSAAGSVLGEGGPANLIKRIQITATPSAGSRYPGGRIVDCTPRALLRYAIYQRSGGKFVAEQAGSTLGNGAAGTYGFAIYIPIFFADSNLRNENSTALNTDDATATPGGTYASVQVQVLTGDLTTCFSGWTGTQNFAGVNVDWVDTRLGLAGDTLVRYMEDHTLQLGATNPRQLDAAMPTDGAFESWLILQEESALQNLSNALFNKTRIESPSIDYELYAADIYQQMMDNGLIDPSQTQTGQLLLDFTQGALANAVNASQLSAYFDVTNVSGAYLDQLRVMTRRVYAPTAQS